MMQERPYHIKQLHQLLQRYRDTPFDLYKYKYSAPTPISRPDGNTLVIFTSYPDADIVNFVYRRNDISTEVHDDLTFYTNWKLSELDKRKIATLLNRQLIFYLDEEDIQSFTIRPDGRIDIKIKPECFTYLGSCRIRITNTKHTITKTATITDTTDRYIIGVRYGDYTANYKDSIEIRNIDGLVATNMEPFRNILNVSRWVIEHSIKTDYGLYLIGDMTADWYIGNNVYPNTNVNCIRLDNNFIVQELIALPVDKTHIIGIESYRDEILFYLTPPYRMEIYDRDMVQVDSITLTDPIYGDSVDFDDRSVVFTTLPTSTNPGYFYYAYGHGNSIGNFDRTLVIRYDRAIKKQILLASFSTRSRTDCYYVMDLTLDNDTVYLYLSNNTYITKLDNEILTIDDKEFITPDKANGDFMQVVGIGIDGKILHNPYEHDIYTDYLDVVGYKSPGIQYSYNEGIDRKILKYKDRLYLLSRLYHPNTYIPGIGVYRTDLDGHVNIYHTDYRFTIKECVDSYLVGNQWILSGIVSYRNGMVVPSLIRIDMDTLEMNYFVDTTAKIDKLWSI